MYLSDGMDDQDGYTVRRHPAWPGRGSGSDFPLQCRKVVRSQGRLDVLWISQHVQQVSSGPKRELSFGVLVDVLDSVANRANLLGVLVLDLDVELLLHRHDDLDEVERVGIKVADELGTRDNFFRVDAEAVRHDILYTL